MDLGSSKTKDGVPTWNGEAASFQDYEESALLWEQSVAVQKRYLCGPRLAAELGGAAKRLVVGKRANWLSHNNGVADLLNHLRSSLGRPQVSELTEHLSRYFKGSRKRPTEGMNEYITRKSEVYTRACQALRRVAPHQARATRTPMRTTSRRSSWDYSEPGPDTGAEEEGEPDTGDGAEASSTTASTPAWETGGWGLHDWNPHWQGSWWSSNWQWGGASYGTSWWNQGREVPEEVLPDLLPDFVQGWYLLHDAGLDLQSRNTVITALQGDFAFMKVAQELRNQHGEDHRRKDNSSRNAGYMGDHVEDEIEEDADPGEDEAHLDFDPDEAAMWNDAEEHAQEALAVMQNAKKTLREARQKQHAVKLARGFYKPNFANKPRSETAQPRPRDDSQMICLRCGKKGHRVANCDQPPVQGAKMAEEPGASSSFVCYAEGDELALSVGLSTEEAVSRGMAVIDGGATKTLSSIKAIENIMGRNMQTKGFTGLVGLDLQERPVFSFGNGTQDRCASTIKLQLDAESKKGSLTVHCFDRGEGPLLLSIDALRKLDAIIDCRNDLICLRALDPHRLIKVERSQTGHQLLSMTSDLFKEPRLLHNMANLNKMTREDMKEELEFYNEFPPASWTRLEMKTRLLELRGSEGTTCATSPLQEAMKQLRKAARKKPDLITFCREHQVSLNGNETIAMMEVRAAKKLQMECPAHPYDHVGFGKHSSLMYIDILRSYDEYSRWVQQMYIEDPKDTDPRLRRLARWLLKTEETQKEIDEGPKKGQGSTAKPGGRRPFQPKARATAASSRSGSTSMTTTDQETSRRLDQMADVIEQLKSELAATRGEPPRKGMERRYNDAEMTETDGSYSVVSNQGKREPNSPEK
ncbi:unnamed protein product [Symbiodinium sp. CCMP2456]|nr:unnamed protein product [Symbiodinium sp. CCMP2456]